MINSRMGIVWEDLFCLKCIELLLYFYEEASNIYVASTIKPAHLHVQCYE